MASVFTETPDMTDVPHMRPARRSGLPHLAALLLMMIPLAGCATFGLINPEVSLVNLKFTDLTLFETSGVFIVRLTNENPEPMFIEGGVYNLYLGGWRIGKGLSNHRLEVPPLSTTTDEIELHLSNLAIATQLRSIYESGVADYRIKAKIYVEGGFGRRRVTVEKEGRFDFRTQTESTGVSH